MKNSFSINIIFILLTIIGLVLIPQLTVQLHPQQTGNTIHVGYSWPGMGAEVVDKEVTSPIEGTLSAMRGVSRITSESYEGRGSIRVSFKKGTDMDAARFEASSLMRSIHGNLPEGVALPRVSYGWGGYEDTPQLLIYTVNGEGSSHAIKQYVDRYIVPRISNMSDISSVYSYGATSLEWELEYDKNKLNAVGLNENHLRDAVRNQLVRRELGTAAIERGSDTRTINLTLSGIPSDSVDWSQFIVGNFNNRVIRLTDVASPRLKESESRSYYRVNGLSSIYLVIHSTREANQVELAARVKEVIKELQPGFPPNFSLLVNYDASEEISTEVQKISSRALLALIILLLFVLLVSRKWRYLFIIALSLVANLSIAVIFYYFLGIEIHLYSLAGITVSLGMIIDNTIVMADHIRHSANRKAFLAILAATLTTMGAMIVIFFLKEEQRLNLIDFAIVMLVNLGVSLFIALFFVPSLLHRLPIKRSFRGRIIRRKRRIVKFSRWYERFLRFGFRWRWAFILVIVWGFGFPVFFLPDKLDVKEEQKPRWYHKTYNQTLGNQNYVSNIKPWVNRVLGGSWYWFTNYFSSSGFNWDSSRTRLYARGSMPDGSTIHQMNDVFVSLENYLAQFDEIELFTTRINNIDNPTLEISFTPEAENGAFPHILRNELIREAIQIGSADFSIYGVGQGFSNAFHDGMRNNRIEFHGYNYELMLEQAGIFRDSLLLNPRIQEVILQTGSSWRGKPRYGFVMGLNPDKLEEVGSSLRNIYYELLFQSPREIHSGNVRNNKSMIPVYLREASAGSTSVWDMNNNMLSSGSASFRLKDVGFLNRERTGDMIRKENQEYRLLVEYDFIGPWELNRRVRDRYVEMINDQLPVGFSAIDQSSWWGWNREEKSQYWLLLIVAVVVFVLCAILFESLLQPLAVIASIPVAFTGLFLTFSIFKINFDQGGYAAMILLCGLTVNAVLYIINDYNNMKAKKPNYNKLKLFLKAFNHKIIPIILTTLSTTVGLLPFLLAGKDEGFWFSLSAGAIGGLLFSLLAVVVWLPLILVKKV
ncbi:efflux RND transporter permease subunit [Natronoflexus pectinivorans]|uniref:Multidrug efflux pump subunit AcrB n=1 Tax=Natronoflexus pectinivorans TaxID=682526 RepID=A0A4R2G9I7_9BACT|nr:efflux RND transporter permease subunit [Natronoflexus pectinivorans]TCO04420.1 multidrug efflux pump subunit AcrB [Natronoflexus pectinivorans]